MRGDDQQQHMFSYLSPEKRVRKDHPLRAIRAMVDEILTQLSLQFDTIYARVGRPSIAPARCSAECRQAKYSKVVLQKPHQADRQVAPRMKMRFCLINTALRGQQVA